VKDSSGHAPWRGLRREPENAHEDDRRLPHNTLSAAKADSVCVHYSFHPLCGQELRVFVATRSPDGAVTVEDAKQKRLKIPLWMVATNAARFELADAPTLDAQALLRLVELSELHCDKFSVLETYPQRESGDETALVDRAASRE
jgi:hypothetical protein